jgi:hypothetical protein
MGKPDSRASSFASNSAWLYPRVRCLIPLSGTGMMASTEGAQFLSVAAIGTAMTGAAAEVPLNFNARTAERAGPAYK